MSQTLGLFYLEYVYTTGPERGSTDNVGPFHGYIEAVAHRLDYGPYTSTIRQKFDPPSMVMSPEDHIAYVSARY
jgi:hypothetical protein